jgi:S-adenosylmethionine decarboxylase proenzyme
MAQMESNSTTIGKPRLRGASAAEAECIGQQIVLDLYECETERFDDIEWVQKTLVEAAERARATIVQTIFHKFAPWGISGVVVIAESHISIHTWPERRYAAVDVFTCGPVLDLERAVAHLVHTFRCKHPHLRRIERGEKA